MRQFYVKPEIHRCNKIKEFIKEFNIGEGDLILATELYISEYIIPLNSLAIAICVEEYKKTDLTEDYIDKILIDLKDKKYKRVIAIGGPKINDIAKALSLKLSGSCSILFSSKRKPVKDKQLVFIPVTISGGSEMTSELTIKSSKTDSNEVVTLKQIHGDYIVFIPEMYKNIKYDDFILGSIEILIHASEAFVSPKANSYTDFFSHKAIEIILMGLVKLIEKEDGYYKNLIDEFFTASNYAGIATENTGLGTVQALAYPLSKKYNISNAEANYAFYTQVFTKYNEINPVGKIKYLNNTIAEILQMKNNEYIYRGLQTVLDEFWIYKRLEEHGAITSDIREFSKNVVKEYVKLTANNYVHLTNDDFAEFYRATF